MPRFKAVLAIVLGCCSLVSTALAQEDNLDKYRYKPDIEAVESNPLSGQQQKDFDCLDKDGNNLLTEHELDALSKCLGEKRVEEMGLNARPAIIIERLDADRDREITPREYKTWSQ
ncbi:hypothetical protein QQM79_04200 [Marinobacteraceae bacterium S3BR75-40.1]